MNSTNLRDRADAPRHLDLPPDSRLYVLSNCGHWTMIEKTAEVLAVVQQFLAPG
jgi:pimeloyl-ACP methyl ester carboxylesterase